MSKLNLPPDLPSPSEKRLAVRLTADAERHVRSGHPWIFDASIASVTPGGLPGDLAVVFDESRRFVAIGLYDPASPIRVKVIRRGRPTPIDAAFWRARLDAALERRSGLAHSADTNAYRCLHGENDGFPGLVLDRYSDVFVLKLYSAAWVPHLATLVAVLDDALRPSALVLRLARALLSTNLHGLTEPTALLGSIPSAPVMFTEHGLTFEADVVHGQKTGHFLDQRDNRARLRSMVAGTRVLDVFAYTGGFSVSAAAGGATEVCSVDLSAPALATTQRNFAHNDAHAKVSNCHHEIVVGDAFEVLSDLAMKQRRFDAIVIDPPSFASRQASVAGALRAYGRLTAAAIAVLEPGGLLVQASCSSRISSEDFFDVVRRAALDAGVRLHEIERTGHGVDHPIGFPQGSYLKAIFARI